MITMLWFRCRLAERPASRPRPARPTGRRPLVEELEGRCLLSDGLSPTLVALGGATPLPIKLGVANYPSPLAASPFGGPDIYQNFPGPADAQPPVGNEPNQLTNFTGFYAGARVQGSGLGSDGVTYLWDADLRAMQGVYQGLDGRMHQGTFIEV
jgi:hypothetical protein